MLLLLKEGLEMDGVGFSDTLDDDHLRLICCGGCAGRTVGIGLALAEWEVAGGLSKEVGVDG